MSTRLLCYLKQATWLEDFWTHLFLSHLPVGVIFVYNIILLLQTVSTTDCPESFQVIPRASAPTGTGLSSRYRASGGQPPTAGTAVTATIVYAWLLLKKVISVEDPLFFTAALGHCALSTLFICV